MTPHKGNFLVKEFLPTKQLFNVEEENGKSSREVMDNVIEHLSKIGAKTVVIEKKYTDKDYIIDYARFYARSFRTPLKWSSRIHFFSSKFNEHTFTKFLINSEGIEELQKSYLGFLVLKPIRRYRIGRTILVPPSDTNQFFLKVPNKVSLFGIPLEIHSLPYQVQDEAVSACSTIALWTSLYPLHHLFNIPLFSPSEITEISSSSLPGEYRRFPTTGLSLQQVINFINYVGLEVESINTVLLDEKKNIEEKKENDIAPVAIKAYLNAGIPIIAILQITLVGDQIPHLHAVVINGYKEDPQDGAIKEIYTHDDRIGPFNVVHLKIRGSVFPKWEDSWINFDDVTKVELIRLLVPLYPKIRLSFGRIYYKYLSLKNNEKNKNKKVEPLLFFTNDYKKFLLTQQIKIVKSKKLDILTKSFPRFIWVLRLKEFKSDKSFNFDILFDATDVFPDEPIGGVYYIF